ncbi:MULTISPECIES: hypothetical protein [unclassified Variovorax]|uniref:hypothetical protein n=1 Tax=unclassified Variovorax TaxID=663243 RepID=UPI0008381E14|nr:MULTISPECIES: hypothetical protein [unclassified Variovorax]PNG58610.1 hypothetical protein CHC07_00335 [Variovorax sp. B4]PNG61600.1 hypothetical protein CHC06_01501 [Variovorax sp. B2]VTV12365.1 hypothetical protein WDL1CHR_03164 [Variovorax sp. WDL1]
MNDQGECPIPDTHQKLKEATYFLGKCAEHYHVPAEFQFNLNAFIQALRNTTFMLQNEPRKPEGFGTWYASKQAEMRQSDLLRRFVQARNVVVKQSSLKARSTAWSGVFRRRRFKLGMQHPVPLFAPSEWVLERLKASVGFFLDEEHSQPWEQFGVHRTWVVEELGETEVLGLCVQALNYVGAVLEEAHSFFGSDVESTVVAVDMPRTQTLLETDVDSSLVAKWGWDDAE